MSVRERILTIKLLDKIADNPEYARKLEIKGKTIKKQIEKARQ